MKPSAFTGLLFTSLLIFISLGYFIDNHFHTARIFTLVGFAYSLIGSFYLFLKGNGKNNE